MTEQIINGLLVLAGVALTACGVVGGAVIASRSQRRAGDIAAKAATQAVKKSAEESLIDQLQEELARYREQTDSRLDRLERENQSYRDFIFVQRDHMVEHGVKPPPWPNTLPR